MPTSDQAAIRLVLERFPYGIFIVATNSGSDGVVAVLATWVSQISFDPTLIAVSLERGGVLAGALQESGEFSVNIVPSDGIGTAKVVLKSGSHMDDAETRALFARAEGGVPVLRESAGVLLCHTHRVVEAGDHDLILAEVTRADAAGASQPLSLEDTGWKYRQKNS
jgi:flavin reductase (DIM6/NTAB) family NADH-FMN oxidoreductase RutF